MTDDDLSFQAIAGALGALYNVDLEHAITPYPVWEFDANAVRTRRLCARAICADERAVETVALAAEGLLLLNEYDADIFRDSRWQDVVHDAVFHKVDQALQGYRESVVANLQHKLGELLREMNV